MFKEINNMNTFKKNQQVILVIMDGYGISSVKENNAILCAKTPNLDSIFLNYPKSNISASGLDVGLPNNQMGNSEVGHTNIGSGRIIYQELTKISKAIIDKDFFNNIEFIKLINYTKEHNTSLHIIGLLSDGGIHSHIDHILALLQLAYNNNVKKVYLHAILDGRDSSPTSGKIFLKKIYNFINKYHYGKIATIIGRYYAMDRNNNIDRTKIAYNALVNHIGKKSDDLLSEIDFFYKLNITDEFIEPIILNDNDCCIKENDSVIFANFRPDRARQLTYSLMTSKYSFSKNLNLNFVCMTQYDEELKNVSIAYKPNFIKNTLGECISKNNLKQLRIAETEKYAHVTFFFNGGIEKNFLNEDRILIPSPNVKTYDQTPNMSAYEITKKTINILKNKNYDFILLNFANCDMVGHTGNFKATIDAVETIDKCIGELKNCALNNDFCLIITSDHGNAEKMYDDKKNIFTSHTNNNVPLCIIGSKIKIKKLNDGKLCDIAPTILDIMMIEKPTEMTGNTLIIK